ncbi:conserved hypothetical protein [Candidatus Terasakiella magnetica]|uniref:DUF2849 domain-containing protein n=1 Tax=Candidatus Terasakiella magnetica TaxID=1867952 RepID=A0A1C3RK95_9PROT|nr:DUF2849 domain-containing protein [Candidatus Terasakiella magnetica]SCA57639.1 conserved hypothetical protein [Candidatus Terasakiella magnetica]
MANQVVTANRLDDGLAVFYASDGQWYNDISKAEIVENGDESEKLLERASDDANQLIVVGPYLIDVEQEGTQPVPVRYREMIRTKGPSVRPDLGYQAK